MTVKEKAYAKINIYLDVTGKRDDGFHDIISVMQSVSLCDDITLTAVPADETVINITSNETSLDNGESNLIYRSAAKYLSKFNANAKVNVELIKRIPIGAGLGGGSSDAAATLRAMNKIFGYASNNQLFEMAAEIGSDVPFCLLGGCALCSGRGEKINAANADFYPHIVIAIGVSRVSTPKAYSLLDERYGDFVVHNRCINPLDLSNIDVYNIFESVINSDEIDSIKEIMIKNGAKAALMSGSGPSVFGGFEKAKDASAAKKELESRGFLAFECQPIQEKL